MPTLPVRHRRARRTDFDAVVAILETAGAAPLKAERADLRRFRRLVADLHDDLYVALAGERVVGLVHVSYTRQIAVASRARIETLCVAPDARGFGVGASLIALARARALGRGCRELGCTAPSGEAARGFLLRHGWQPMGESFRIDLPEGAQ